MIAFEFFDHTRLKVRLLPVLANSRQQLTNFYC